MAGRMAAAGKSVGVPGSKPDSPVLLQRPVISPQTPGSTQLDDDGGKEGDVHWRWRPAGEQSATQTTPGVREFHRSYRQIKSVNGKGYGSSLRNLFRNFCIHKLVIQSMKQPVALPP
ncbi:unnamed protein product [Heligmosomoides polygyrus]|uniref:Pecanex-like protein n=1 Tax=Heligmosomoides polygyrus TaxID=6339 RepID=A0A183FHR3_HELPZ|nr:unnamed protein product [Heligmosomoides polygyrus]